MMLSLDPTSQSSFIMATTLPITDLDQTINKFLKSRRKSCSFRELPTSLFSSRFCIFQTDLFNIIVVKVVGFLTPPLLDWCLVSTRLNNDITKSCGVTRIFRNKKSLVSLHHLPKSKHVSTPPPYPNSSQVCVGDPGLL